MNGKLFKPERLIKYIKDIQFKKNLGVFLIFIFLSTILWFLNQLEDHYVTQVTYPVQYTNMPQNKVVVGELPEQLDIKVNGRGFNILEYKISGKLSPITLPVSSYNLKQQDHGSSLVYYIPTKAIKPRIEQQLSSSMEVLEIIPDTLFFEFADRIDKKVPVEANIKYSFGKQMMLKGDISIEPDSIRISGPSSILDTIDRVSTRFYNISSLRNSIQTTINLEVVHDQVDYSTDQVTLEIPVETYTEGELKKDIIVRNSPDSVVVRTFPSAVTITYLVGLSNYEKVIPELFKVYADYESIGDNTEQLKVYVEKALDYLKSYSYSPQKVDYIIERTDD